MSKPRTTLERMRANPQGDWTLRDVERLCSETGLIVEPPTRGSHFKVYSARLAGTLTLPARRPIKPVYIRQLVGLVDAHLAKEDRNT